MPTSRRLWQSVTLTTRDVEDAVPYNERPNIKNKLPSKRNGQDRSLRCRTKIKPVIPTEGREWMGFLFQSLSLLRRQLPLHKGAFKYVYMKKRQGFHPVSLLYVGAALFSRSVSRQVFLALVSLTAVFGMGTGGPSPLKVPTLFDAFLRIRQPRCLRFGASYINFKRPFPASSASKGA